MKETWVVRFANDLIILRVQRDALPLDTSPYRICNLIQPSCKFVSSENCEKTKKKKMELISSVVAAGVNWMGDKCELSEQMI